VCACVCYVRESERARARAPARERERGSIHLLRELIGASLTISLSKAIFYLVSRPDECHPIHLPPRPPSGCVYVYVCLPCVSLVFIVWLACT
jgi:hypothetical protein